MSLVRVFTAGCIAATALASGPGVAQQAPAPPGSQDIVVTGRTEQPSSSEVTRQAREITDERNLRHSPMARFEDRLCPGIMGLKEEFAALMIDRIRYNAERLDRWMGSEDGCSPNLIVAFVDDGQAAIQGLAQDHSYLFSGLSRAEYRRLLDETGPVRVWTTTEQRTRDGMRVAPREDLVNTPVLSTWSAHSKIYLAVRSDITQVVILFDRSGVRGKTLVQLADYATMRGLARTRPVEDGDDAILDTILALFRPESAGPTELTDFDRAYLASLYEGIPNLPGTLRMGGVARELRQAARAEANE